MKPDISKASRKELYAIIAFDEMATKDDRDAAVAQYEKLTYQKTNYAREQR